MRGTVRGRQDRSFIRRATVGGTGRGRQDRTCIRSVHMGVSALNPQLLCDCNCGGGLV